jgi:eukaryotic-like serine/threonine-protein kinase
MRDHEGRLVAGRYRLRARLGSGGMGTVWRATDEFLEREVAVKEVTTVDQADPGFQRTLREARTSARLRHPGIVTIHDVVVEDGRPWLVMEMVDGHSLAELVERDGPLPQERAASLARQLLDALAATHRHGVLHRDVKPGNVLLDGERVVLADFGIAAIEGATALTATNVLIGSPQYLSPERINGQAAGPPSDLWALGVTLYFAVTGASPFQREDTQSVLAAVLTQEPPAVAGALGPVVDGLLRKDPAERLTTDAALALLDAGPEPDAPTEEVATQETDTEAPTEKVASRETDTEAPTRKITSAPATRVVTSPGPPGSGRRLVYALVAVVALATATIAWLASSNGTRGGAASSGETTSSSSTSTEGGVPGSPTFDRMTARGKIVIGVGEDLPGLGYRNPADGSLTGFEIELATLVADRLGFDANQITFTPAPLPERGNLLVSGAVDLVVNSYVISEQDKALVGFAGPYLFHGMSMLLRRDEQAITDRDTLRGHRLCLGYGTIAALNFNGSDLDAATTSTFRDSTDECVEELRGGEVDAVVFTDLTLLGRAATESDQLKVIGISPVGWDYGIGLPRDDKPLRDEVNDILTEALTDGSWREIYDRTLGRADAAPTMPTVQPY